MSEKHPLPCFPCPHTSACCAYGTTLTDEEAGALIRAHGPAVAYQTRWGEWRTRVRHRRCVLFQDNRCVIHGESFYPAVCRGFPWTDAETGGPYEFDRTICPEFLIRPELIPLGKPPRNGRNDGTTERGKGSGTEGRKDGRTERGNDGTTEGNGVGNNHHHAPGE